MDCTFEFERGVVSRWSSARDNVNMIIYPHSLAGINSDILEGVLEHLSGMINYFYFKIFRI